MPDKFKKLIKKKYIIIAAGLLILVPLIIISAFILIYRDRIYPNIYVSSTDVGGLNISQAEKVLSQDIKKISPPETLKVRVETVTSLQEHTIDLGQIDYSVDYQESLLNAFETARSGDIRSDVAELINLFIKPVNYEYGLTLDDKELDENLAAIAGQVSIEPIYPYAKLVNGQVLVNTGAPGEDIDKKLLRETIINRLKEQNFNPIETETISTDPSISSDVAHEFKKKAEKYIDKQINVRIGGYETLITDEQLISYLEPDGINKEKLNLRVNTIANEVNQDPINPVFNFENGKVTEFKPAQDGLSVQREELLNLIQKGIETLRTKGETIIEIEVPATKTPPEITTDKVNDLGINELIGRGSSQFKGSIASRMYNINLAASRLNGILIPPGEEFSFNQSLGDVSKLTGYKEAYVIKDGKTVLGDGGGVCQVSTTMFRAAMNAGLPITERRSHSYRVGYYEQDAKPGLDATVYSPYTDLKFKNDTPAHILIQSYPDTQNATLVFELYGTSDGRVSKVTEPVVYDVAPPPEDLYIDDPTLPEGTVKQIDYAAWGAKSTFDYVVQRDGETIIDTSFFSNYRPWQAKFLRGTGPQAQ